MRFHLELVIEGKPVTFELEKRQEVNTVLQVVAHFLKVPDRVEDWMAELDLTADDLPTA